MANIYKTQRASALFFIAEMEGERMAKDKIALGRPAEVICRDSNR